MSAWLDGWRRVLKAPAAIVGVYSLTFVLAIPLAWTMRDIIRAHLGSSTVADAVADDVSWDWWQEFLSQTSGLGTTLQPQIIGFAATLDSVGSIVDRQREVGAVIGVLALYLVAWTFITGGLIDRYARQRPTRAHGFFSACGTHFFRFLRLALVGAAAYALLFGVVHPRLFTRWYPQLIVDVSSEQTAFAWRLLMYTVFGLLVGAANLLLDYARIRIVVEDRRSVLGAVLAAVRFIGRNARPSVGLYLLNTLTFIAVAAGWALIAPGVSSGGWWLAASFATGQLFIVARLLLKLHFLASQTSLFQHSLAHAAYVMTPPPTWPQSPAAETIVVSR